MISKVERAKRIRLIIPGAIASLAVAVLYGIALVQVYEYTYCRLVIFVSALFVPNFVLSKVTNWMMKVFQDAPTKNTDGEE